MKQTILFIIYLFVSNVFLCGEIILLEDGSLVKGTLLDNSNDAAIVIQSKYGRLTIPKDQINDTFLSDSEYKDYLSGRFNWKRHFFDLTFFTGGSLGTNIYGGLLGISIGYQYQFNQYFAFGPGLAGFGSLVYQNDLYYTGLSGWFSGGVVVAQFMIGSLYKKRIAFLFDVGAGWIIAFNLGIYIKGFVIKVGYHLTGFGGVHNITIGFGYKFNWKGKR